VGAVHQDVLAQIVENAQVAMILILLMKITSALVKQVIITILLTF
jgi:hypothetical protein